MKVIRKCDAMGGKMHKFHTLLQIVSKMPQKCCILHIRAFSLKNSEIAKKWKVTQVFFAFWKNMWALCHFSYLWYMALALCVWKRNAEYSWKVFSYHMIGLECMQMLFSVQDNYFLHWNIDKVVFFIRYTNLQSNS